MHEECTLSSSCSLLYEGRKPSPAPILEEMLDGIARTSVLISSSSRQHVSSCSRFTLDIPNSA